MGGHKKCIFFGRGAKNNLSLQNKKQKHENAKKSVQNVHATKVKKKGCTCSSNSVKTGLKWNYGLKQK